MPKRSIIFPDDPTIAIVPLTKNQVAIIDRADAEWASKFTWHAHYDPSGQRFYALRSESWKDENGVWKSRTISMHKELCPSDIHTDHVDGDSLNNRRDNLRAATRSQNKCNGPMRRDNVSGYKGVIWHKHSGKWAAYVNIDKKQRTIGRYFKLEDAVAARIAAAEKHYGEFARHG